MMKQNSLNILIVSDGKKGHEDTSFSIINAIQDIYNIKINLNKIRVKIRLKLLLKVLNIIIRNSLLKRLIIKYDFFINLFYKFDRKLSNCDQYDFIVSSGGDTVYYNIYLSSKLKVKNIFASRIKKINTENFFLIISTFEKEQSKNTIYLDFPPLEKQLDNSLLTFEKEINSEKEIVALLIGGNGAGYKYSINDFRELISNFVFFLESNDLNGLITTSRRTLEHNDLILKDTIDNIDKDNRIKYSIFFNLQPEYLLGNYLYVADYIFVTEDSGSMITESILTNKPVYTLIPRYHKPENLYNKFVYKISNYLSSRVKIKELHQVNLNNSKINNIQSPYKTFKIKLKKYLEDNQCE